MLRNEEGIPTEKEVYQRSYLFDEIIYGIFWFLGAFHEKCIMKNLRHPVACYSNITLYSDCLEFKIIFLNGLCVQADISKCTHSAKSYHREHPEKGLKPRIF